MSETENKYESAIIYKIYCKDKSITDTYIGSTTGFYCRRRQHKCYSKTKQYKVYKFIREHNGWDNFIMQRVEYFPCKNNEELLAREGLMVKLHKAILNHQQPARTIQQCTPSSIS